MEENKNGQSSSLNQNQEKEIKKTNQKHELTISLKIEEKKINEPSRQNIIIEEQEIIETAKVNNIEEKKMNNLKKKNLLNQ